MSVKWSSKKQPQTLRDGQPIKLSKALRLRVKERIRSVYKSILSDYTDKMDIFTELHQLAEMAL